MKNLMLYLVILITSISIGQEKKNTIQHKIFEANIEENHYLVDDIFPDSLKEIKEEKLLEPYNNSEGKFPKYESKEITLNISENIVNSNSLETLSDIAFIDNKLIQKLIETNIIANNFVSEQMFYGDREVILLKEYPKSIDKLNINYKTNSQIDIQIGKKIYSYINKLYKSEIDKTLQNSLNLLVINF